MVRVRPGEPWHSDFPETFGDQQLTGTDSHHPVLIAPVSSAFSVQCSVFGLERRCEHETEHRYQSSFFPILGQLSFAAVLLVGGNNALDERMADNVPPGEFHDRNPVDVAQSAVSFQ